MSHFHSFAGHLHGHAGFAVLIVVGGIVILAALITHDGK